MIDLNKFNRPFITREAIKENLSDYDIYRKYIHYDFKINEVFKSPFRKDNIPSFGIFKNSKGELIYNDFVLGGGDIFAFVKYLFQFKTWWEVYSRIAIDFWLDSLYNCKEDMMTTKDREKIRYYEKPKVSNKNIQISVKIRKWKHYDINYWKQFGIKQDTLIQYKVFPIEYVFLKSDNKESLIKADKYAYAYIEHKDCNTTYKIYQPFSKYKWISNHDFSVWQGWNLLPSYDEFLVITKSLKDVMALRDVCKIPSVALQSEKALPKDKIMYELCKRFQSRIFLLYDNDYDKNNNWGQLFAQKLCDKFDCITNICIPSKYECKDFSDLVKKYGKVKSYKIIQDLLITESTIDDNLKSDNTVPF